MAEHPPHGASKIQPTKDSGEGGGGPGKWLIGGLAALVLVGGGYAAWKTVGPGQDQTQSAYNDTATDDYSSDNAMRAGPLPGHDNLQADSASLDDSNAAPAPAPAAERRSTARRSTPVRTAEVPEETIGITPINATSEDVGDDIVVRGQRRPVWSRVPNERALTALYPERARMRGREGEARLQCTVQDGGALDCVRAEESSSQFGAAAMRVARSYRHAPTLRDGTDATGTPVNLRVVFRLEDEERGRG